MWKASSRKQIRISGVRDDILVLPGKKYRLILETSAVNLELKSEDEQEQITKTYARFLNSLAFDVQLVMRTRAIDVEQYLEGINSRGGNEQYAEFVRGLVTGSKILTRRFYVIIPFESKKDELQSWDYVKEQLNLAKNLVTRGLTKMGIKARQLGGLEVIQLFYSFYNPDTYKLQKLADWALKEGSL